MVNIYRLVIFTLALYSSSSFSAVWTGEGSAPPGYIDLAGFIKDQNGVYSRAFSDQNGTRATPNNNTVTSTSHPVIQTSKGLQTFDVTKTAVVDVSRVGKAFAKFAIASGPVGMAINIAQLACDLSNICKNSSGDGWETREPPNSQQTLEYYQSQVGTWCFGAAPCFNNVNLLQAIQLHLNPPAGFYLSDIYWIPSANNLSANAIKIRTSTGGYWREGLTYTLVRNVPPPASTSHPTTQSDWDSKSLQLNDPRFVPELVAKGADVPTQVPTIVGTPSKTLSEETTPTRDPQGNVTGSKKTTITGELADGVASAEKPGGAIYRENTTVINYDINNTVINSTTTTTTQQQPEKQSFEIKFDEVPPANMQTYQVPNTFASTSWGSGQCPPDVQVNTKNVDFSIPTEPICDTAIMVNPFMLMLSTLIGIYIISGVRGGANPS